MLSLCELSLPNPLTHQDLRSPRQRMMTQRSPLIAPSPLSRSRSSPRNPLDLRWCPKARQPLHHLQGQHNKPPPHQLLTSLRILTLRRLPLMQKMTSPCLSAAPAGPPSRVRSAQIPLSVGTRPSTRDGPEIRGSWQRSRGLERRRYVYNTAPRLLLQYRLLRQTPLHLRY